MRGRTTQDRTGQDRTGQDRTGRILCLFIALAVIFAFAATTAYAAIVNFGGVSNKNYVLGNDGIGGTDNTPGSFTGQTDNNAYSSSNTVNVTGGTVNDTIYGGYFSDSSGANGTSNSNQVDIKTFTGSNTMLVYGGYASKSSGTGSTTASNNRVVIDGGIYRLICGGNSILPYTGSATTTASDNNTVSVKNVTTSRDIVGGVAYISAPPYGASNSTANGNTVIVEDSIIGRDIFGGCAGNETTGIIAYNNNTVTLMGNTSVNVGVYGGKPDMSANPPYNNGNGNTLKVKNPQNGGITVGGNVQYFQKYSFEFPAAAANGYVMLDVTGTAYVDNCLISLSFAGAPTLAVGNVLTLISGTIDGTPTTTSVTASGYNFAISVTGGNLIATVASVSTANPPTAPTAPAITTTALPNGTVGAAYSQTLAATGTAPITWTLDSGTLPAGLTLSSAGVISGTPTAAGTATFTVKAANGAGSDTRTLTITVNAASSVAPSPTPGSGGSGGGGCDAGAGAGIAVLSLMAFSAVQRRLARRGR
jgi:hypothetical protein